MDLLGLELKDTADLIALRPVEVNALLLEGDGKYLLLDSHHALEVGAASIALQFAATLFVDLDYVIIVDENDTVGQFYKVAHFQPGIVDHAGDLQQTGGYYLLIGVDFGNCSLAFLKHHIDDIAIIEDIEQELTVLAE